MEAGRARCNRDNPRFRLSLGLTSVRHIVNKLEAEYSQPVTSASGLEVVKYQSNIDSSFSDYDDFPFGTPNGKVWSKFVVNFGSAVSRCVPSVTFANFGVLSIVTAVFAPKMISYLVLYPFCRLVFGTLYPAYASYKAVRTKNLKEYVKWMMYWIVFALFTCTETFTDVFLSWFPFYYEVKIVLVLWLLSPATKGSSILYRKFVHPALCRREQEIDEYIAKAKDQGYHTVLNLGTKGVNYATTVIMQTAIKNLNLPNPEQRIEGRKAITARDVIDGQDIAYNIEYQHSESSSPPRVEIMELDPQDNNEDEFHIGAGDAIDPDYEPTSARSRGNVVRKRKVTKEKRSRSKSKGRKTRSQSAIERENEVTGGGGLVQQLRKSYSLSDLTECEPREERAGADEADDVLAEPRLVRRAIKSGFAARRSASESNSRQPMYFPEVDVDVRSTRSSRSDEPDFSHIKSTEDISSGYSSADNSGSLTRTGSMGAAGAGAARSRARATRTTTITTIKRPQAAEDNEVHIEELQDDDLNIYTDMPSLVNISSSCLYLSHTNPPFIYQYDGKQVRILQVLGQLPTSQELNQKDSPSDERDQNNISTEEKIKENSPQNNALENNISNNDSTTNAPKNIDIIQQKHDADNNVGLTKIDLEVKAADNLTKDEPNSDIFQVNNDTLNNNTTNIKSIEKEYEHTNEQDTNENGNLATNNSGEIFTDNYSSDDEASFGTPNESPKSNRKHAKGKYGKNKAPLPPSTEIINTCPKDALDGTNIITKEILDDEKDLKEEKVSKEKEAVTLPDSDKSRSSSIGQLIDNVPNKEDSSLPNDESKDISEILLRPKSLDDISFKDAIESENEITSHNIIEKSDILQKLIEAKIESHPEYKFVPLKDDIKSISKSTDV
ncbi:Receptor expression-enhancing protein 2 [Papilio xuthus]|uniref:Receptor expression-enhancing protein 2 n=1 Tax=Papilio xuthus TaxID=66420 RepID=A0A194PN46_PAPXU|nr:Receptor expression-enhancing protein 2 [Papilio xuthus]